MCHNILVEKEDLFSCLLGSPVGNVSKNMWNKWLSGAWINSENNIRNENHEYSRFSNMDIGVVFFLQTVLQ